MIPANATPLSTLVYLDISPVSWTSKQHWKNQQPTDQEVHKDALTDFGRVTLSEQRLLSETLQGCITDWKARVAANRTAIHELSQLGAQISTVSVSVEVANTDLEVFSRAELLEKLESATEAYAQAVHRASIRLKALQTTMVRRAMLGANAGVVFEPPSLYTSKSGRRHNLSKIDRRNYEIILQLENRTFHSPTQYFREIGRRAVKGRGKPVGHATINGWFKKEGLYKGKDDRDTTSLQARAVDQAKKVLAAFGQVSKD